MIKNLCLFFISFTFLINTSLFANNDSVPNNDSTNIYLVQESIDSLVNLWYVKRTLSRHSRSISLEDTIIPKISDSIAELKLSEIQSIIPLTYNSIVQDFINLYTLKRRKQVSVMLGLADEYFPVFEKELDAAGLPLELRYIPVIESALNKLAVSRAGATGMWQFMYPTAKLYKLKVNSYVDERRDPYLSTVAAVKFLKEMYGIYYDWQLVIAAYNCGPGNVNKAIRRSGGKTNFWEIYNYLPRETRGYVPAFIAANYVFNYHQAYNISKLPIELSVTDTLMVYKKIHFGQIADVLKINMNEIRELNPQYRKNIIPATKKHPYPLRLPNDFVSSFITLEDTICHYKDSVFFASDYQLSEPQKKSHNYFYSAEPDKNSKKVYYTIKPGDNLGFIADWYDVTIQQIKLWNNISGINIKAGNKLVVFIPKSKYEYYKKINSLTFTQKQSLSGNTVSTNATNDTTTQASNNKNTSNQNNDKYVIYTVRSGDNFWSIAKKYPGISNFDIMKLNRITNERSLKPGQKLKIKKIDE